MSSQQNKAAILQVVRELEKGNLAIVEEMFSPKFAYHSATNVEGPLLGLEGARKMVTRGPSILADVRITVEDTIAEDDKVAVRWTFRGTYVGAPRDGFPKPGEKFTQVAMSMYRFADGKIEDDSSLQLRFSGHCELL